MKTINRQSFLPLYIQLKDVLLEDIDSGRYPLGALIPTEMTLVDQFGVSRATVRQAIKELEHEGFVSRMQGKGTIVIRKKSFVNRGLSQLTSFTEDMLAQGHEVTTEILEFDEITPPCEIATFLQIEESKSIIYINRLRFLNNNPIAINTSYVNLPSNISLSRDDLERSASLYKVFEIKHIPLISSDKFIEAISADENQSSLLRIPKDKPLLKIEGIVYTLNQRPLEYHTVMSRSDLYKYSIHLHR